MCLSGLTFVVTFASSVFSTALVPTEREFHISQEAATLGTSIYVLVSRP
jgi:DHA1 family multidrug resistance protein-like MFS transporter